MKVQGEKTEVKSVGDQFIAADGFKTFAAGATQKAHVELHEVVAKGDQAALNPITTPPAASSRRIAAPAFLPAPTARSRLKASFRRSRSRRIHLSM